MENNAGINCVFRDKHLKVYFCPTLYIPQAPSELHPLYVARVLRCLVVSFFLFFFEIIGVTLVHKTIRILLTKPGLVKPEVG